LSFQQDQTPDIRPVLRWTVPCGLIGTGLAIVGNLAHPTMPTEGHAALTIVAGMDAWTWIHFIVVVAALLTLLSLVGILQLARNAVAARLGLIVGGVGAAVLIVAFGIDGFTTKAISDLWASAGPAEQPTLLLIGHAIELVHTGLFYLWLPLFLGGPPLLFGVAFWGGGARILGVWGVAAGLAAIGIGCWCFLTRQFAVELAPLAAAFASVLWFGAANLVAGRTLLQRPAAPAP
jgi:hypothetical protein